MCLRQKHGDSYGIKQNQWSSICAHETLQTTRRAECTDWLGSVAPGMEAVELNSQRIISDWQEKNGAFRSKRKKGETSLQLLKIFRIASTSVAEGLPETFSVTHGSQLISVRCARREDLAAVRRCNTCASFFAPDGVSRCCKGGN